MCEHSTALSTRTLPSVLVGCSRDTLHACWGCRHCAYPAVCAYDASAVGGVLVSQLQFSRAWWVRALTVVLCLHCDCVTLMTQRHVHVTCDLFSCHAEADMLSMAVSQGLYNMSATVWCYTRYAVEEWYVYCLAEKSRHPAARLPPPTNRLLPSQHPNMRKLGVVTNTLAHPDAAS